VSSADQEPDPELARALDQLPQARARENFRSELERRFVGASRVQVSSLAPLVRWGAVLTAAAGLIALLWPREPGPQWNVLNTPSSLVRIDGQPYTDLASIQRALESGRRIETTDAALVLELARGTDQLFVLGLQPHTSATLPDEASHPVLADASGDLAVITGTAFPGNSLTVRTLDAAASITGTEFAVDTSEQGTCICCATGEVSVESLRGTNQPPAAGPGRRSFVKREVDGYAIGEVYPPHVEPLTALRRYRR
jgi:hypothetical protein